MSVLSNPRHELFVKNLVGGASLSEAFVCAGYSKAGAAGAARRLLQNVAVKTRLDDLQREVEQSTLERVSLSREWVLEGLKTVAKRCMQAEAVRDNKGKETGEFTFQAAGANRALELLGKELGMFVDRTDSKITWNGDPSKLTAEQRAGMMAWLEGIVGPEGAAQARAEAEAEVGAEGAAVIQ
jgi:phage terminase small subunit